MNPWPQLFRHKSSPEFADQFGIPHDSKIFCNSPSPPPVRRSRPSRRRPSRPERGDRGHRRRRSRRLGIPAAPPESQCPQAPKTCQRSDERVWGRASKQEKGRRSCTQRRPRWAVKRNKRKRNINYTKNHTGSPSDLILIFLLLSNFSSHPKAAWQLSTPPAPARNEDSAASQSGDFPHGSPFNSCLSLFNWRLLASELLKCCLAWKASGGARSARSHSVDPGIMHSYAEAQVSRFKCLYRRTVFIGALKKHDT